jgi:hypothetical protein
LCYDERKTGVIMVTIENNRIKMKFNPKPSQAQALNFEYQMYKQFYEDIGLTLKRKYFTWYIENVILFDNKGVMTEDSISLINSICSDVENIIEKLEDPEYLEKIRKEYANKKKT